MATVEEILHDSNMIGTIRDYGSKLFFSNLPARSVPGTVFDPSWFAAGTGGDFRASNNGVAMTAPAVNSTPLALGFFDFSVTADVKDVYGTGLSPEVYMSEYLASESYASYLKIDRQIFQGLTANAGGFKGLDDLVTGSANLLDMADGTTASGKLSKIYYINTNQVELVFGNSGNFEVGELEKVTLTDTNGSPYSAWRLSAYAYVGLLVRGSNACKIGVNVGTSVTDALLGKLRTKFDYGMKGNLIAMSDETLETYRASKTATSATGVEAMLPESVFGCKIVTAPISNSLATVTVA